MARKKSSKRPTKSAAESGGTGSGDTRSDEPNDDAADSQPLARMHIWQIQAVRDALGVAVVVFILWLGYAMRAVTVPLLGAVLLAYICEPLVRRLSKHPRITRPMAVGGILATLGVFVALILAITIPVVVRQTQQIADEYNEGRFYSAAVNLRRYVPEQYQSTFDSIIDFFPTPPGFEPIEPESTESETGQSGDDATSEGTDDGAERSEDAAPDDEQPADTTRTEDTGVAPPLNEEQIRALVREEIEQREPVQIEVQPPERDELDLVGLAVTSGKRVLAVLGGLLSIGFVLFIVPFYFFFFSLWFPHIQRFIHSLVPKSSRDTVFPLLQKMDAVVAGFVRGRLIICFIMGVLFAAGWGLVGVPYWLIIGLITGAFSLVPYLGGVGVPAAIALLIFRQVQLPVDEQMAWWGWFLWPTVVFVIVQVIEGYILTPYIFGKQVKLDPVTLVVAVLAGASLAGVYGMILAIPVAACLKILLTDVFMPRYREWARGEREDFLPIDRGH